MWHFLKAKKTSQNLALRGDQPGPKDPKAPEILEEQKKARDAPSPKVVKSEAPAPSSSQPKRKSANSLKGKPPPKKSKIESAATIPKVDKGEVTELNRVLRESEDKLQSARTRVKRLEDREDEVKNSYKDMKEKSEEKLEDYDNLQSLKRATYNHFLAKWEHENEKNQGEDITALKNAFPLTLRRYFSEAIEKEKDSLKHKSKNIFCQK